MKKQVILFAGTTEGREISRWLAENGIETLASVATEYGRVLMEERAHLTVRQGRMTAEEMKELFAQEGGPLVVDATHPYASAVSENICQACRESGCEYLRLIRPALEGGREETETADRILVESVEEAVEWLSRTEGRILVTTGSKELPAFTALPGFGERVFARMLPSAEAVRQCLELGFSAGNLILMQGPFSREMNRAMIRQTGARYLVTKESGKAGGFAEKLEAAKEAGATVVLIKRPAEQEGMSVEEGTAYLSRRFSIAPMESLQKEAQLPGREDERKREDVQNGPRVWLVGIGMGLPESMTEEARQIFDQADCILGSGRMLDPFRNGDKLLFDSYDPEKMTAFVKERPWLRRIAVALSGDVGFYSGAPRLVRAFEQEGIETELIPGISSLACFLSRLKMPWEDVKLMSVHGRRANVVAAVKSHRRTFTLLGARDGVRLLCEELLEYGLSEVTLYIGERLCYPGEKITKGRPEELRDGNFDGLCVALIENPRFENGIPGYLPDEAFLRGEAPMTKSEIRILSVARLDLRKDSVVWDVGAGTGSVTVEIALRTPQGQVYAIEKKDEAASLIRGNCVRFGTPNVQVIPGTAPEALKDLPAPTHVFVGGSSGHLKEILEIVLGKNPRARVVINGITLETVSEANSCLKELPVEDVEITAVQTARAKKAGPYQMMTGMNPVYLFSCRGKGEARHEAS